MELSRIHRRMRMPVGPLRTWDLITRDPSRWFGHAIDLEPRVGGRVACDGKAGTVRRWEPGVVLEWEWSRSGDPGWTIVTLDLARVPEGTDVEVTEVLHAWEFETYPVRRLENGPQRPLAVLR